MEIISASSETTRRMAEIKLSMSRSIGEMPKIKSA
jgi:hypothetical protein